MQYRFPQYTAREIVADRALHLLALPAAIGGIAWLLMETPPTVGGRQTIAEVIYGCGLIGMLTGSAALQFRSSRQ